MMHRRPAPAPAANEVGSPIRFHLCACRLSQAAFRASAAKRSWLALAVLSHAMLSPRILIPAISVFVWLGSLRITISLICFMCLNALANVAIKWAVQRPRPTWLDAERWLRGMAAAMGWLGVGYLARVGYEEAGARKGEPGYSERERVWGQLRGGDLGRHSITRAHLYFSVPSRLCVHVCVCTCAFFGTRAWGWCVRLKTSAQ
eukprot:5946568-Pleurochrysis_carterae.AAC.2